MQRHDLVLASQSPARLSLLVSAGFAPIVIVSGIEEVSAASTTEEIVADLARKKALSVAMTIEAGLVLGCDSMLDVEGTARGKPTDIDQARTWWRAIRGKHTTLYTGHFLYDVQSQVEALEVVGTTVVFGHPSDEEIEAYLESGEALQVAGGFTLERRSGPFIDRVDGDPCAVQGLSLAALARLLRAHRLSVTDLWIRKTTD